MSAGVQAGLQKACAAATNKMAQDMAVVVAVQLKINDGPCSFVLHLVFERNDGLEEDGSEQFSHRHLQAFYHMGIMFFAVQLSGEGRLTSNSKTPMVFSLSDPASAAVLFSTAPPGYSHHHVHLRCADAMHWKCTYPWVGSEKEVLGVYIDLCENARVGQPPVPVRIEAGFSVQA